MVKKQVKSPVVSLLSIVNLGC